MKKTTLRHLIQSGLVKTISNLRVNAAPNSYPFVTLMGADRKSMNLYFSIKSAEAIMGTFEVGDNILAALKDADIIRTESQQPGHEGEVRYKLSCINNSQYATTSQLAEAFGIDEEVGDFDIKEFNHGWSTVEEIAARTGQPA